MRIENGIPIFGDADDETIVQIMDVQKSAIRVALMADAHLGYVMPIGGVAAYDNMVSVVGVGFDIACGNCAIKTDLHISELGRGDDKLNFMLTRFADEIQETISFGIGRTNKADDAPTDHSLFDSEDWLRIKERAGHGEMRRLRDKAIQQLGTVGSGNHYVDVFTDEEGFIWTGVHFGSRGLGHGIATGFLNFGITGDWFEKVSEQEVLLSLYSSLGQDYWALMELAGQYAYAGREWVARKVVEILGAKEVEMVHNHHNFAWKEKHAVPITKDESFTVPLMNYEPEKELIVVRKGSTPAFPGQKGFVGGSMGDISVILQGKESTKSNLSLFSTVHGAGRVMSRTEAKGKINRKTGQLKLNEDGTPKKVGKVTRDMMTTWLSEKNVILRGGDVDESPQVYRRLPDVLAAQEDTIEILHVLTPRIVVMAGDDIFDPYKD